jgi:putative ABC transport system substrate-binding protein
MRRREFITVLGGAAAWPLTASAQQPAKLPTIGFLGAGTPSAWNQRVVAFSQRLRELGWIESRTIAIDYRWADGRSDLFNEIAADFVQRRVDVIVTAGTAAVFAVRKATSVIPIVFAAESDPVGSGVVDSLARPGGNATGLSLQQSDLAAKRLELLREVLPNLRTLAIMANAGAAGAVLEMREVAATARTLGIDAKTIEIRRVEDISPAFEALKGHADALFVCGDPLFATHRVRISILATGAHLPTMHGQREPLEVGGLMSYGPNFTDLFRRAADYVDKILRGGKPSDIPVEQPTKFELVVNLITAQAIGLTILPTLLARADEVIE